MGFRTKLLVYTLVPLGFGFALFIPVPFALLKFKLSSASDKTRLKEQFEATLDRFWKGIVVSAFMVYPFLSQITLESYNCKPETLGLLAADPSELCPGFFSFLGLYSFIFAIMYSVGIPIFSLLVMIKMGVPRMAERKVNAGLVSAMIALYMKRTTSIEASRIAQIIGRKGNDDIEYKQRINNLYYTLYPEKKTASHNEHIPNNFCFAKRLEVKIISGQHLPKMDLFGTIDGFCEIGFAFLTFKTTVKMNDPNPVWNEVFYFDVEDLIYLCHPFRISIMDWDRRGKAKCAGEVIITANDMKSFLDQPVTTATELECCLQCEGKAVFGADVNPSKVKFCMQIKNGLLGGVEVASLRHFVELFDLNEDKNIDEDEFFSMVCNVTMVTSVFTGAESGDNILDHLTVGQLDALLLHCWPKPGESQSSNQSDCDILRQIIRQNELKQESELCQHDTLQLETRERMVLMLLKLAKSLRKNGIIALPPIVWSNGDSLIRTEESCAVQRIGFIFLGYNVEYWCVDKIFMLFESKHIME
jgi:hypothetical protein